MGLQTEKQEMFAGKQHGRPYRALPHAFFNNSTVDSIFKTMHGAQRCGKLGCLGAPPPTGLSGCCDEMFLAICASSCVVKEVLFVFRYLAHEMPRILLTHKTSVPAWFLFLIYNRQRGHNWRSKHGFLIEVLGAHKTAHANKKNCICLNEAYKRFVGSSGGYRERQTCLN